jgi:hypothetical protein
VSGSRGNQMREPFQGDRVSILHELPDGFV